MATAVAGVNESGSADQTHDMSSDMQKKEQLLNLIGEGFNEEAVFRSDNYQYSMAMLEDEVLKGD